MPDSAQDHQIDFGASTYGKVIFSKARMAGNAPMDPIPESQDAFEESSSEHGEMGKGIEGMREFLSEAKNIRDLKPFIDKFLTSQFFSGLDDYETEWNYRNYLIYLCKKKVQDLNEKKGKKNLGDKETWDAAHQIFSICVPCFNVGRTPQRCIFNRKVGFVNHRRVKVGDPTATSFDKCKNPSEDCNVRLEVTVANKSMAIKRFDRLNGYSGCDFRLFQLPGLREEYTSIDMKVRQGYIPDTCEWDLVDNRGMIESELEMDFRDWIRDMITGKIPGALSETDVAEIDKSIRENAKEKAKNKAIAKREKMEREAAKKKAQSKTANENDFDDEDEDEDED